MAYMPVFESQYGQVVFDDTHQYVYHTFKKPVSGTNLHNILEAGLDALKANGAHKWLSDDRNNSEVLPNDINYSLNDWGPRAAKAGWTHWALVVPESLIGRASMTQVVEAYFALGVKVAVFADLDEARAWLVSV